ncbi:MAG: tRNA uridine-5-carboxymethylaminomethyl(34) synthesis GTPase MnmE [Proteobacteria bacterium]|nr:tRNA uridine-5-carboxymethylaminomethyl(34) synthesis GTPase MnmE [Pseudomonadota bacterium]
MTKYEPSTIAAISTPPGTGGIGIIKISGPLSITAAHTIFKSTNAGLLNSPKFLHRKIYFGYIVEPESNRILDEAILFIMKSPHSYTCEDVVEIQLHSSPIIMSVILDLLLTMGIRLAEPGEFTKRAFLNGRIDLIQAESIIDLIESQTKTAGLISAALLKGELGHIFHCLKSELIDFLSLIEASIDFPDENLDIPSSDSLINTLNRIINEHISRLVANYTEKHHLRDGINIVIAGGPNVGKSSLMNCILKKEKSIVTPVPGTTRDIIDDTIILNGTHVVISDTAGIHQTNDLIERIGVEKAKLHIQNADIVLLVIDISKDTPILNHRIYTSIIDKQVILVLNKIDLVDEPYTYDFSIFKKGIQHVFVSAKNNQGIPELKNIISNLFSFDIKHSESQLIPTIRQKNALDFIQNNLYAAIKSIADSFPLELVAIDIKACIEKIGEITGDNTPIDILDTIFNNFCIGK